MRLKAIPELQFSAGYSSIFGINPESVRRPHDHGAPEAGLKPATGNVKATTLTSSDKSQDQSALGSPTRPWLEHPHENTYGEGREQLAAQPGRNYIKDTSVTGNDSVEMNRNEFVKSSYLSLQNTFGLLAELQFIGDSTPQTECRSGVSRNF